MAEPPSSRDESAEPDPSAWDEEITPIETPQDRRRLNWWIEVGVVMCLAWLPLVVQAIFSEGVLLSPDQWRTEPEIDDGVFVWHALQLVVLNIQVLIPLLWIIWRSDMKWGEMFVARFKPLRDFGLGVTLAGIVFGVDLVAILLFDPAITVADALPSGAAGFIVLGPTVLLNSFAEEFVWRGFLLQRFRQLFGSGAVALVVSSVMFAAYHIYQGPAAALLILISGLIWGASVLALRSLWPAVVAHTVFNIYAHLHFAWWPEG